MCSKRKEIDISDLLTTFEIQAVRLVIKRLMKIDAKKKGADLKGIENTLFHVLNEYRSFDIEECIDANSNVDKIAFAEAMACLEMAIKEPIMYYEGNWKELFYKQHFLHDEEWAKEYADNNYEEEDDD